MIRNHIYIILFHILNILLQYYSYRSKRTYTTLRNTNPTGRSLQGRKQVINELTVAKVIQVTKRRVDVSINCVADVEVYEGTHH